MTRYECARDVVTHVDVPGARREEAAALLNKLVEPSRGDAGYVRYDVWHQVEPRTNHLFTRVRDYLIAYVPDEGPVWIVAVIHGHRDPRIMAAIVRGRE